MAKKPTRLRFTEDDLADSHVKKAAVRADKAADKAEKAVDKLASKQAKPKPKLPAASRLTQSQKSRKPAWILSRSARSPTRCRHSTFQ